MQDQDDDIEQWVDLLRGKKDTIAPDAEVALTRQIRMAIVQHELRSIDQSHPDDRKEQSDGDAGSARLQDDLFGRSHAALRQLAAARLGIVPRQFMDVDSLVHETYVRMTASGALHDTDQQALLEHASKVMRSIVIDFARDRLRRRNEEWDQVLDTELLVDLQDDIQENSKVHEALQSLKQAQPRLGAVAEMHYIGRYSHSEIADVLKLSERTVWRDLEKARLLLSALLAT